MFRRELRHAVRARGRSRIPVATRHGTKYEKHRQADERVFRSRFHTRLHRTLSLDRRPCSARHVHTHPKDTSAAWRVSAPDGSIPERERANRRPVPATSVAPRSLDGWESNPRLLGGQSLMMGNGQESRYFLGPERGCPQRFGQTTLEEESRRYALQQTTQGAVMIGQGGCPPSLPIEVSRSNETLSLHPFHSFLRFSHWAWRQHRL